MSFSLPHSSPGFRIAASIEATPRQIIEADWVGGLFPLGTRVYLTDVGTSSIVEFADAARRLADAGYIAVPHFPARRIASECELAERLKRLTGEAGVDDVMVIAGSSERPAGPYHSSMDLLRTGLFGKYGIGKLGVAGHPEGSPDISLGDIAAALEDKQQFARDTSSEMRIVTQFGFDATRLVHWANELAAGGIMLPIHLGVAGPAKVTTLLKYAAICGVGASMDFLKKRASSLVTLATSHSPEGLVGPIEAHVAGNPSGTIRQIHVFPFGGLRKSAEWLAERGSWFAVLGEAERHIAG